MLLLIQFHLHYFIWNYHGLPSALIEFLIPLLITEILKNHEKNNLEFSV